MLGDLPAGAATARWGDRPVMGDVPIASHPRLYPLIGIADDPDVGFGRLF